MVTSMITINSQDKVTLINFDDGKVNVLNESSLKALIQAFDDSRDAGAVVLMGGGKCFSAGLDLKTMITLDKPQLNSLLQLFSDLLIKILDFPCPVVAAVNGHAIAGGAVLTLCCDYAVGVEQELKIGLSEVAVGMPLPTLVVELARNRLSAPRLTEAVLFGRLYSWEDALQVGYLHQSAPAEKLRETALAVASQLSKLPRPAYHRTKQALFGNLPKELGSDAIESFLTGEARKHMSQFS